MQKIPLLDLGNVVVKVNFEPFLSWLTERSAEKNFEKSRRLLQSSLFYEFEFGVLSPEGFARRLSNLFQTEISVKELENHFCEIFPGLVDGMSDLLDELAAAGPIYCLTNTNELHLAHLKKHYPVMGKFTKIFASHEIRKRKPYPGIYRSVATALNVEPERLLFFDDVHANVEGALRAGLDAHLFVEAGQVRARLKENDQWVDKA